MIRSVAGVIVASACIATSSLAQTTELPVALRTIVYRNAPFLMHETRASATPLGAVDHILRYDFDGTLYGPGKRERAGDRSLVGDRTATAYFSAAETGYSSEQGYYYLGYYFYHPQDKGADFTVLGSRVVQGGHEHDLEGVIFVVRKSAFSPYGTLIHALTQAHAELVPYTNTYQTLITGNTSVGSSLSGQIEFWEEPRYSTLRPVVGIRSWGHGTHMAQDSRYWDLGYGMRPNTGMGATYPSDPHEDSEVIVYRPVMEEWLTPGSGYPGPAILPMDTTLLVANYQLIELSQSPFWAQRSIAGTMYSGNILTLADGSTGYAAFHSLSSPSSANPPWQWQGGGGCNNQFGGAYCWYNFGVDGTGSWNNPAYWPVSSAYGKLLLYPHAEFNSRISGLPGTDAPYRYNPYLQSPPNYYGPQPLYGGITGPNAVGQGGTWTWTAAPRYGTPPYRYEWSGMFSGTGESVSGPVDQSGDLFLDIYDAAGKHVSVSIYIYYTGCPGSEITC